MLAQRPVPRSGCVGTYICEPYRARQRPPLPRKLLRAAVARLLGRNP
jgi:hypothetical protein